MFVSFMGIASFDGGMRKSRADPCEWRKTQKCRGKRLRAIARGTIYTVNPPSRQAVTSV
jgi:hypothetical protein